jgi:hypothetical protein
MADTIEIVQGTATTIEIAGLQGPQGPAGASGGTGAAGQGVPVGGTTGQVLRKVSGTNYDTEWAAAAAGSGSVTSVALAGTGLSISGSPVTTSGTITASVSYGTTAGTATQGNDTRIANIRASSVNNLNGQSFTVDAGEGIVNQGGGGGIIAMDGGVADIDFSGSGAGSIYTHAVRHKAGGTIRTNAGDFDISAGGAGGSIDLSGGTGSSVTPSDESDEDGLGGSGGSINLRGGDGGELSNGGHAGSIEMGGENAGATIGNPGGRNAGSISTRGTGSIGFGYEGIRTTLAGTATADRAISLPDATGTVALAQQAADYEVTDSAMGIILKSPNNTRWRLTINNDGTLSRAALALMTLLAFATSGFAQVRDMVTDTNGNIVTGRTNVLTFSNRVSIPISSGAATTNSLLTADGAGGSSFVVGRTVTRFTTNDQARTNWGFNAITQTNNNDTQMGSWSLDANSFYRVEYAVAWVATTNSGFAHGIAFSTNLSEFNHRAGVGQSANTTVTAINTGTNATTIALANASAAATGGRFAVAGFVYVLTSSNANTMNYRWYPINNSADASTLVRSSMLSVTKMSP